VEEEVKKWGTPGVEKKDESHCQSVKKKSGMLEQRFRGQGLVGGGRNRPTSQYVEKWN